MKARFAPSPTGLLHYGNVRTALFNYLLARKQTGEFVLRIEDTDKERSKNEFIEALKEDLSWLGIKWSLVTKQSERGALYQNYYNKLIDAKKAYPCFCSQEQLALSRKAQLASGKPPRYSGTCRNLTAEEVSKKLDSGLKPTLRFHVENDAVIEFTDLVKGPQKFSGYDIGDFIIRRADGSASFMFCNAIDDSEMGITHSLRGEDHLTNTPRQLLILESLGLTPPYYGHFPLIVGLDNSPLSKRNGSETLATLREQGFMPVAIANYLARLGHTSYPSRLLTIDELAQEFELTSISKSPAKHDKSHLLHWQKEYLMSISTEKLSEILVPYINNSISSKKRLNFIEVIQSNILYPSDSLVWKNALLESRIDFSDEVKAILLQSDRSLYDCASKSTHMSYKDFLAELKLTCQVKGKKLFMPIRLALTGQDHGPELEKIYDFLGQDGARQRFLDVIGLFD